MKDTTSWAHVSVMEFFFFLLSASLRAPVVNQSRQTNADDESWGGSARRHERWLMFCFVLFFQSCRQNRRSLRSRRPSRPAVCSIRARRRTARRRHRCLRQRWRPGWTFIRRRCRASRRRSRRWMWAVIHPVPSLPIRPRSHLRRRLAPWPPLRSRPWRRPSPASRWPLPGRRPRPRPSILYLLYPLLHLPPLSYRPLQRPLRRLPPGALVPSPLPPPLLKASRRQPTSTTSTTTTRAKRCWDSTAARLPILKVLLVVI